MWKYVQNILIVCNFVFDWQVPVGISKDITGADIHMERIGEEKLNIK